MKKLFSRKSKRTAVLIHIMHLNGGWPIRFMNDIFDNVDEMGLPEDVKRDAYALVALFEDCTYWDSNDDSYRWKSANEVLVYNSAVETFAQKLANHLGAEYAVKAFVCNRPKSERVDLKWMTYLSNEGI
jgi:hypothetical protein